MNGGDAQIVYYIALGLCREAWDLASVRSVPAGLAPALLIRRRPETRSPRRTGAWITGAKSFSPARRTAASISGRPMAGFRTQAVSQAPIFNGGIFVAMPEQILVAWGSVASGEQQDPLTVRWSDALDYTNWTVTITTQAGSFRIPTGSMIVGGIQGPQQALIWTDLDVYAMQYLGPPLVFGFNKISTGCGLIGQHAVCTLRGIVYWMSSGNFFQLGGRGVQEIPCRSGITSSRTSTPPIRTSASWRRTAPSMRSPATSPPHRVERARSTPT
jgi:hypothetical protein